MLKTKIPNANPRQGDHLLRVLICAVSILFTPFWGWSAGNTAVLAGTASEDITPEWPVRKAFVNRPPIHKVYQRIEAKALALSDRENSVVVVTADIRYFCPEISQEIHKRVARLRLKPHQVVLNASHSHSGPALCPVLDVLEESQIDRRYQELFISRVVRAIESSLRDLRPARLGTGEAECDVCINKRIEGRMEPNPMGPIDRRVRLLTVRDARTDVLRAVLFLYGCHPSDLNDDAFGADFFGFAREELERNHPGVLWSSAQGTAGDTRVDHRDVSGKRFFWGDLNTIAETRSYGKRLAQSVERALRNPSTQIRGPVGSAMRQVELPLGNPASREESVQAASSDDVWKARWGRHLLSLYDRQAPIPKFVPYTVQAVQIGPDFRLVALDGEVFTHIGRQIEDQLRPRRAFVFGYSNTSAGYIPTADEISKGGYEIEIFYWWLSPGPFASSVEKAVVSAAVTLAR
jgi:neutral ceramidase